MISSEALEKLGFNPQRELYIPKAYGRKLRFNRSGDLFIGRNVGQLLLSNPSLEQVKWLSWAFRDIGKSDTLAHNWEGDELCLGNGMKLKINSVSTLYLQKSDGAITLMRNASTFSLNCFGRAFMNNSNMFLNRGFGHRVGAVTNLVGDFKYLSISGGGRYLVANLIDNALYLGTNTSWQMLSSNVSEKQLDMFIAAFKEAPVEEVPVKAGRRIPWHIIEVIEEELIYQDKIWKGKPHPVSEWVLILENLVGEAKRKWYRRDTTEVLGEVRQIAATAIACMEQCGVDRREE